MGFGIPSFNKASKIDSRRFFNILKSLLQTIGIHREPTAIFIFDIRFVYSMATDRFPDRIGNKMIHLSVSRRSSFAWANSSEGFFALSGQ
jgi:hypothetical protein